jgi:hypothetical protein
VAKSTATPAQMNEPRVRGDRWVLLVRIADPLPSPNVTGAAKTLARNRLVAKPPGRPGSSRAEPTPPYSELRASAFGGFTTAERGISLANMVAHRDREGDEHQRRAIFRDVNERVSEIKGAHDLRLALDWVCECAERGTRSLKSRAK